jgi:hypothetical protein
MVLTLPPRYPHRQNRDGSFDSICLKCLLTIATARNEADLAKYDKNHICIPSVLSQRAFDRAHERTGSYGMKWADWAAVASLFLIVLFGVVLIGHAPKWPVYVTVLVWWAFVIYTTIHINHEKNAAISAEMPVTPVKVTPLRLS